jgi:general secretion pathway protein F
MQFHIKAFDIEQGVLAYAIDAQDEAEARRLVQEQGRRIIAIAASRNWSLSFGRERVPIVPFCEELVSLLDAGLNLLEAIEALTEKEAHPGTRRSMQHIRARLLEGATLSVALAELPASFPALFVATVRASERSGAIRESLERYVAYQRQIATIRKKLVSASIYPLVLCGAGVIVTFFLLGYVVPRFSSIYEDLGGRLPLASRLLMQWGKLIAAHGAETAIGALSLLGLLFWSATRPGVRAALRSQIERIPAIGRHLHAYQIARLYRTVGMLLRGGVPAVSAMQMSEGILALGLRPAFARATLAIREGLGIAQAMERQGLTTPVAVRMLRVGERSGNMGEMMERIARFYDEELARSVDVLTRLIEPLLMSVIGIVIGVIVVLMYFPIFELAGSLQ